jgi:hypothetical protein
LGKEKRGIEMICICGMDHSKPLPANFDTAPIVYSSSDRLACCHACGAIGPQNRTFFTDEKLHKEDCVYMKFHLFHQ